LVAVEVAPRPGGPWNAWHSIIDDYTRGAVRKDLDDHLVTLR